VHVVRDFLEAHATSDCGAGQGFLARRDEVEVRPGSLLQSGVLGLRDPDSSADHSFKHGRFEMVRPNALARMMALSMLRLRGLATTMEGGSPGHARQRPRICFSPRSESGARSKFDVYGGRMISPCRTRTSVA